VIGIFGANGFIGTHLTRRLALAGASVRAVSRRFDESFVEEFNGKVELIQADLRRPIETAPALYGLHTVVQLISTSTPALMNEHILADLEENVLPHVEFIQNCLRADVKRYVFLSSGGTIYGPNADIPTPETHPTNPINSHGLTKLVVEKYIQMHGHVDGLGYLILRLANPFGRGQRFRKGQGLVAAVLEQYRKRLPVQIYGDGSARRDYIYIDDVIDAIVAALGLDGAPRLIVNIGSGTTKTVVEVIDAIEEATGYHFERQHLPARETDVAISRLDISKARDLLGWKPRTPFSQGIANTVAALDPQAPGR